MKVGFLFNHDAGHQVGHLAPIVSAYAAAKPDDEIRAYIGGAAVRDSVKGAIRGPNVRFIELAPPAPLRPIARALDIAMPASRWTRLRANVDKFRDLDALVAPERTSLLLRKALRRDGVKFIYSGHGAGDRAIGFHPSFSRFDLLLLPGEKYARRLRETGGISGNEYVLIGYPKFDFVRAAPRPRLFDNNNPTVVYNPHFSPEFSSWFSLGLEVLDWFASRPSFNLVFAPHVMLFRRRIHVSPETFTAAWRRDVPRRFKSRPNILIDTASQRLFDMTYMRAADLYLGDISSQVMEFLVNPRPCVFINAQRHQWEGDENFAAWRLGEIIERVDQLEAAITSGLANPDAFRPAQVAHFEDSFSLTEVSSADRAAAAIRDFVRQQATAQKSATTREPRGAPAGFWTKAPANHEAN